MPPLVSVVVPAYNHAEHILATLDSVFAQTYAPYEVIVVNDGSPDDTEARLAPLVAAGRIRYVRQENAGVAAARNAGAALARGTYLAFLDDDDLWPPDTIGWRVAMLEADPALALVFGTHASFSDVPPPGAPATVADAVPVGDGRLVEWSSLLAGNPMVSPGQALVRRSTFEAERGFDPTVWGADDWDLWLRLGHGRRLWQASRTALYYRLHERNASRRAALLCENVLVVIERHLARVDESRRPHARFLAYTSIAPYWRRQIRGAIRDARARGAWSEAAHGLRTLAELRLRVAVARLRLKLALARRGRWRLSEAEQIL